MREKTLTLSAFAKMRGVSRMTVHRWRDRGHVLLDENGRVRVAASNAMLADRVQTYRGGQLGGNPPKGARENGNGHLELSIAEAIAKKEKYSGLLRKLEYEKATGQLCEISVIAASVNEDYVIARNRMMSVSSKVVPLLLGTRNPEEMKALIDREVARALEGLSADDVINDVRLSMGDAAAPVADDEDELL